MLDDKDILILSKFRARQETSYAIKRGYIEKMPCRVCGATRVEAHHIDYTEPLDIVWLCKGHHMELHYYVNDYRPEMRELSGLQAEVFRYIRLDPSRLSLQAITRDCGATSMEAAAIAVVHLLLKGFLKPIDPDPSVENCEEIVEILRKNTGKSGT